MEISSMRRLPSVALMLAISPFALAGMRTWDGQHDTQEIEVTVVYFVPADRRPLPDWRERVDYFCRRIELFHAREFQGQSVLKTAVHSEPFVSQLTTAELRSGPADSIFFRTLQETDRRLGFAQDQRHAFPILLVLSEINWRPLDDFYRLKPEKDMLAFEGTYTHGEHFPGAASGGARASYLADRGVGWALVSADGWRVPYRGSDCVAYHEGCGHTVGLPHPEPGDGSVMSLGQYRGWLSESWLDKEQKVRLGWEPQEMVAEPQIELFSRFRALPQPRVPQPGQSVVLALDWPDEAKVRSLRVRFQTSVDGPWIDVPQAWNGNAPRTAKLGTFDRPTPVSYRVDTELQDGTNAELWGYFQVRKHPQQNPEPFFLSQDLIVHGGAPDSVGEIEDLPTEELDLLGIADVETCWCVGQWSRDGDRLLSPKQYGARLELPYSPPDEYRLVLIVEPLDEPDGLILGQRSGGNRFVTLLNFTPQKDGLSAIENVHGRNVGNETTFTGNLFQKNRPSQVIVAVRKGGVTIAVDGRTIVNWKGPPDSLSLSGYWKTPDETALFLGAYDCRYRFHRITLEPASGEGRMLKGDSPD
jgi:hypothetical protein